MRAVIYLTTQLPVELADFIAQANRLTRELNNPTIRDVTYKPEDSREGLSAEMGMQITGEVAAEDVTEPMRYI